MGKQKTYSWGFKLQMVHLLGKGAHIVSQISRDYHVTRSLLYARIWLYQERGEAAFVPSRATQYPPEIEQPQNALEQVAYLERLLWATGTPSGSAALGGGSIKKSLALVWRQAPIQQRHTLIERLRELMPSVSVRKLYSACRRGDST
jgi:transposase-like protein